VCKLDLFWHSWAFKNARFTRVLKWLTCAKKGPIYTQTRQINYYFFILFVTNNETVWTKTGYSDLNDLGRALEKHNKSKEHIAFACKFVLFRFFRKV
jgi:hypothetical protein